MKTLNPFDYPKPYREALAVHEGLRKLGFQPEDIYFQVRSETRPWGSSFRALATSGSGGSTDAADGHRRPVHRPGRRRRGQGIEPSGELADAMADLDYVVEGTRLTFGIDGWPVLLEVQRANMAKTNQALQAADAAKIAGVTKAQKPEGWTPPDIADVLRKQGWND